MNTQTQGKTRLYSIIAGIVFLLAAAQQCVVQWNVYASGSTSYIPTLVVVGYGILGILSLIGVLGKAKDNTALRIVLCIPIAIVTFTGFAYLHNSLNDYGGFIAYLFEILSGRINFYRITSILALMLEFLAPLALFIFIFLREKGKSVWFIPFAFLVLSEVVYTLGLLSLLSDDSIGFLVVYNSVVWSLKYAILPIIGYALLTISFANPTLKKAPQVDGEPDSAVDDGTYDTTNETGANDQSQKHQSTDATTTDISFNLGVHVLLLLFTCGIYYLHWIYRTTECLNCVDGEEPRNPVTKLLLCIFIPFYYIYWVYISAQRIDTLARSKNITSELTTLCFILAIFVPIIPPILMQEKMNAIAAVKTSKVAPEEPVEAVHTEEPQTTVYVQEHEDIVSAQEDLDSIEAIKKYKELLDSDIITQEEYDQKKKQLLGL